MSEGEYRTIIIESLTSRIDELTAELAKERAVTAHTTATAKSNLAGAGCEEAGYGSASVTPLPSDSSMYMNIIETLQSELANAKEKAAQDAEIISNLQRDNKYMKGDICSISTSLSYARAKLGEGLISGYCRPCGETTVHEDNWCVQCAISIAKCLSTHLNNGNSVPTSVSAPTSAPTPEPADSLIIGYQRVITALTDKLAVAYGVDQ